MPLPRPASPRALWTDLNAFWRQRPRHQWLAGALAVAIPIGILVSFYFDAQTNILPREQITYIESWPATRTDEEIKAKQKADLAERRAFQEERRQQFQRLDEQLNRLGI
ncbi:MAG TPA: hypothetical protein VN231_11820 [Allosphingosinicella sp.]|nr:hypothetical protein [Allosphingosinicella sp.]